MSGRLKGGGMELSGRGAGDGGRTEISERKAKHVEICVDRQRYAVESGESGFTAIRFVHHALPEVDERAIDTSLDFLGCRIALPLFISCMTGGSAVGDRINRELAAAAQSARIPVGMGSFRILFRDESCFDQFHLKRFAPDVPVIANLGAVQVREIPPRQIVAMVERLEAQALAVHLNPGQELFQPEGDRDFRGLKEAIARLCEQSSVPVIVKETGFGIRPADVDFLLAAGAAFVDLAGAGGTNWTRVESYRLADEEAAVAREFDDWGIPTAALLLALRDSPRPLLASGGIRSGVEVAKALALGAGLAGLALPFIRAVADGGAEGVGRLIASLTRSLRAAMTLAGCRDLAALRRSPLLIDPLLSETAAQLCAAEKKTDQP